MAGLSKMVDILRASILSLLKKKPTSIPGTLVVGAKVINHLKPLGGYHRAGITKAGRLSLVGMCEGRKVKVYRCHSPQQVALRLAIQQHSFEGLYFPEIVAADSHMVAELWIDGVSVADVERDECERAQTAVERFLLANTQRADLLALAKDHPDAFCYFSDYLLKRLGEWLHWEPVRQFVGRWKAEYGVLSSRAEAFPAYLTHPDLSAANLIVEKGSAKLFIIDNELLGVGAGWVLDGRNSLLKKDVVPAPCSPAFVEQSWRLRKLGSALDADDFPAANRLATDT